VTSDRPWSEGAKEVADRTGGFDVVVADRTGGFDVVVASDAQAVSHRSRRVYGERAAPAGVGGSAGGDGCLC